MDWDVGRVTYSNLNLATDGQDAEGSDMRRAAAQKRFREFIRNYRQGNIFHYREQLLHNYNRDQYWLEVDLKDLHFYDDKLQCELQKRPTEYLQLFEEAAREALGQLTGDRPQMDNLPQIQIKLKSHQLPLSIRELTAQEVNKLVKVPGIVIQSKKAYPKSKVLHIKCRNCGNTKTINVTSPFGNTSLPRTCDREIQPGEAPCPRDPFTIDPNRCVYVDQQLHKLQEAPEVVPTGEMPRSCQLIVERYLVDKVSPGVRVNVIGISSIYNSGAKSQAGAVAIRTPYIRVVGIEIDTNGAGRVGLSVTAEEEELFHQMARQPDIYAKIAGSLAPSISGEYTEDIKKALACQLMGGSRKVLPDGMRLRGDINILLLGDPSTAKSQFLKFIEKVAPIGVYTSGKGSSAAGLTASVIKDARGEFVLEGGAMVLADGGVVCIDEFDKMRESDRVAIHEAMEQQTISIAKAGITTILNSRTSVLAAANPIFGRYDDLRSAAENIDLMTTILSRFDLIFIVRDIRDAVRDTTIAKHVMNVHINASTSEGTDDGEIDIKLLKKYISYCRSRCAPRLSAEAASVLGNHYVTVRRDMFKRQAVSEEESAVPVTVRQLEALVRISESLAKMRLAPEATAEDVAEAIRLFRVSTMSAASSGCSEVFMSGAVKKDIETVQSLLLKRLRLHHNEDTQKVEDEFARKGHSNFIFRMAIALLVRKGTLKYLDKRRMIVRERAS